MSDLIARIERAEAHIRAGSATPTELLRILKDVKAALASRSTREAEALLGQLTERERRALLEAVRRLPGSGEGVVVALAIGAAVGCSSPTVTAALRAAESAGLIEVQSLGRRGTHIRVLVPALLEVARRATS